MSDYNETRTNIYLGRKRTLNHLVKLVKLAKFSQPFSVNG